MAPVGSRIRLYSARAYSIASRPARRASAPVRGGRTVAPTAVVAADGQPPRCRAVRTAEIAARLIVYLPVSWALRRGPSVDTTEEYGSERRFTLPDVDVSRPTAVARATLPTATSGGSAPWARRSAPRATPPRNYGTVPRTAAPTPAPSTAPSAAERHLLAVWQTSEDGVRERRLSRPPRRRLRGFCPPTLARVTGTGRTPPPAVGRRNQI
jgi:hypothetical protein